MIWDGGDVGPFTNSFAELVWNPGDFQPGNKVRFLPGPWGIPVPNPVRPGQVHLGSPNQPVFFTPVFDLHGKLAFPMTCLVMALVGLPFAFSVGKRGAVYGVAIGLVIGLVFWGALGLFTQLGRYEIVPPILAAWGPNLIFGAGGTYLFLTTRT